MAGEWEAPKTIKEITVIQAGQSFRVTIGKNNVDSIKSKDITGTWFDSYDDQNAVIASYQASYVVEILYS